MTNLCFKRIAGIIVFLITQVLFFSCTPEDDAIPSGMDPGTITHIQSAADLGQLLSDEATHLILVRHAEKQNDRADPSLAPAGYRRAEVLRDILSQTDLASIFSTNFKRTYETATPTSIQQGIEIQSYDPFYQNQLINRILRDYPLKSILIVGHSNTIPEIVNYTMGRQLLDNIPEDAFNNLYIIQVFPDGNTVFKGFTYGE